jgi:hypothetical protein
MDHDPVEALYRGMLQSADLSLSAQLNIFRYGTSQRRPKLLAGLAAYVDLHPDLDVELGKLSNAWVKAAWVARPGRPLELLTEIARADTRATVLLEIASRQDLPAEVYSIIAGREFINLDWALLENPAVSADVKLGVALHLDRTAKELEGSASRLANALGDLPEVHDTLVKSTGHPAFLTALSDSDALSAAAMLKIANAIIAVVHDLWAQAADGVQYPHHPHAWVLGEALDKLLNNPATSAVEAKALLAVAEAAGVTPAGGNTMLTDKLKLAAADARTYLFDQAKAASTVDELQRLTDIAVSDEDHRLLLAVVANRHTTPELAYEIGAKLAPQERARAVRLRRDSLDVQVALFATMWEITDADLEHTGHPEEALKRLLRISGGVDDARWFALQRSKFLGLEHVSVLSVDVLWRTDVNAEVRALTTKLVEERLGSNPARWEVFENLLATPPGCLGDTLDVVQRLVPDSTPGCSTTWLANAA